MQAVGNNIEFVPLIIHIPPDRDLAPGVTIILKYLKSKGDFFYFYSIFFFLYLFDVET